jgi:hypothetical protein
MDFIPRGITNLSSTEASVLCFAIVGATIFFTTIIFKLIEDFQCIVRCLDDRRKANDERKS